MRILLANFAKMVNDTGGLAKVHCAFANAMAERGHEVTMMYCDDLVGDTFYPVDERVKIINLQHAYGKDIVFPTYLKLKREILRAISLKHGRSVNNDFKKKYLLDNVKRGLAECTPDVIVSYQPAASKILLCDINTKIPVITMSHGDPEDYFHTYPVEELPSLAKSAVCQVLLPSYSRALTTRYPSLRVEVIGNVVPQYEHKADLATEKNQYRIVFSGRLARRHKRPHLLLEAFARIAADFPNWTVELWGPDSKKTYTQELAGIINKHKLEQRAYIKGVTQDIPRVLASADIFVMPSACEGFSLALSEALSMGLPAIAYKSCPGMDELITDGKTGLLVADGVEPLAEAMARLMSDRELRIKMGAAAREDMRQYSAERIWSRWEQLLAEVVACRSR